MRGHLVHPYLPLSMTIALSSVYLVKMIIMLFQTPVEILQDPYFL
jgi:hypothetical protein